MRLPRHIYIITGISVLGVGLIGWHINRNQTGYRGQNGAGDSAVHADSQHGTGSGTSSSATIHRPQVPNPGGFTLVSSNSSPATPGATQESAIGQDHNQAQANDGSTSPDSPVSNDRKRNPHRLRNSLVELDDLARMESAILLQNASLDTRLPMDFDIPAHLRTEAPAQAYIVQFDHRLTEQDYGDVEKSGNRVISYIPNNALLIESPDSASPIINGGAGIQAVVEWQPYFKFKGSALLESAVNNEPIDPTQLLGVTAIPGSDDSFLDGLKDTGAEVVFSEESPFGTVAVVKPDPDRWIELALDARVLAVEPVQKRKLANDLARTRLGIAPDTVTQTNYLSLTGKGIPVNVNDSGVDASHPDLAGRVQPGDPTDTSTTVDFDGHGTHVAGSIASSGENSPGPDEEDGEPAAYGSVEDANFRGMAPEASIYALPIQLDLGPERTDTYLIERAAEVNYTTLSRTNPIISNNSWGYVGLFDYSLASARFDAAVRDALPGVSGDQPIVYLFAAANSGNGGSDGSGGIADSISAPGTAKNVITVGAIENFRNITNNFTVGSEDDPIDLLAPFEEDTDNEAEVASFSSRGNTGIGTEGNAGRFKPDVVAPGTFVVSTRSGQYVDPTQDIETDIQYIDDVNIAAGGLTHQSIFVPFDAIEVTVQVLENNVLLDPNIISLPMYAAYGNLATVDDFVGVNTFTAPGDIVLNPAQVLNYAIGNETGDDRTHTLRVITTRVVPGSGGIADARSQLNERVGPHYRYESGTSMATPVVTGLVTLMSEYLEKNGYSQSPALLKALLINGARTVSSEYDFFTQGLINFQGWGLVNLTNSLPAIPFEEEAAAVQFLDQSVENALSTGEERTWELTLSEEALDDDLKITLVWTDPPGNPNAGVKLVNDLDLILTNINTTNHFLGNDIGVNTDYNLPASETSAPDIINNVENIFLAPPLSTNYTITVKGSRINVNALRGHENGIVQDFALVVSSGNNAITNAISIKPASTFTTQAQDPTTITNGLALLRQRTSAHSPLLGGVDGQTNQWKFYVFTNTFIEVENPVLTNGPNVAFTTFLPPNLSEPGRNLGADVDLYVSRGNEGLLTLDPNALAGADKSITDGGTETIIYTNAVIGEVFYVGVKAEDQKAAEFAIMGISTDQPFSFFDEDGNLRLNGFPVGRFIEDGSPLDPGYEPIIAPGGQEVLINSVRAEISYYSENFGDILGNLSHNNSFVVLNNKSAEFGFPLVNGFPGLVDSFIYDDSNSGQIVSVGTRTSDGPGNLTSFIGDSSSGAWIYSLFDNAFNDRTRVDSFQLIIQPMQDLLLGPIDGTVLPQRFQYYTVEVPATAVALEVFLSNIQPTLPLDLYLRRDQVPTLDAFDKSAAITPPGGSLTLTPNDSPPLNGGRYFIGVYNPNLEPVDFTVNVVITDDAEGAQFEVIALAPDQPIAIPDHAESSSFLEVGNDERIATVRAGVRVDHPRTSDLSFRLVSPQGDSFLLSEARGGADATNLGISMLDESTGLTNHSFLVFTSETNLVTEPLKFTSPPYHIDPADLVVTNRILVSEDFLTLTNGLYSRGQDIGPFSVTLTGVELDGDENEKRLLLGTTSGSSGGIAADFRTRSGSDYLVSFTYENISNGQGGVQVYTNGVLATFDEYTRTSDNPTRTAQIPIKARSNDTTFELRSSRRANRAQLASVQIEELGVLDDLYVRPEETLEDMEGKRALGEWELQISDDRSGGNTPAPVVLDWKLEFLFANPDLNAITLTNGIVYSGILTNGQTAYFKVPVPRNATIATNILDGLGDLVLLGDRRGLPLGDPSEIDYYVDSFGEDGGERLVISTNSPPGAPLEPGQTYYLGVTRFDDTDTRDLDFRIVVNFDADDTFDDSDIPELLPGLTVSTNLPVTPVMKYWKFTVEDEEIRSIVDMVPTEDNLDLFIRQGRLPTFDEFDLASRNLGTDPEQATLELDPDPAVAEQFPISPGTWYVGILNRSGDNAVNFDLTYYEVIADITELQDSVVFDAPEMPGDGWSYFHFLAPPDSESLSFEITESTAEVYMLAVRGAPVPSITRFDFLSEGDATTQSISLDRDSRVALTGDWYLAVQGVDPGVPVSFKIRASSQLATITALENKVPFEGELGWQGRSLAPVEYFVYEISGLAERVLFELTDITGPDNLDLIIVDSLDNGLPSDINFSYISDSPGSLPERISVGPNSLPSPLRQGPWYIAVVHRGTDFLADPVTYTLTVTEVVTEVTEIFPGTPVRETALRSGFGNFYRFNISTNAEAFRVDVSDIAGDVDLYLRKDLPLPTDKNFDLASENPNNQAEAVQISNGAGALSVEPGTYYIQILNRSAGDAAYQVLVTEYTPEPIELESHIEFSMESNFLGQIDRYHYVSPTNAIGVAFRLPTLTQDFNLYARRSEPYPTPEDFEFVSASPGTTRDFILVETNTTPNPLVFGEETEWFLSVYKNDPDAVGRYVIVADPILGIESGATLSVTNLAPKSINYFRFSTDADTEAFTLKVTNATESLSLRADNDFDGAGGNGFRMSGNIPDSDDKEIIVDFSEEVPGYWYAAVINSSTRTASYDISLEIQLPEIIDLTDGVPYQSTADAIGDIIDYYRFVVPEGTSKASFTVSDMTHDMRLFIRRGRNPLPGISISDFDTNNPGLADEFIELTTGSETFPFLPGEYYLAVTHNNFNTEPAYTITATTGDTTGGGIDEVVDSVLTFENGEICLTWTAIPGRQYRIEGKASVDDAEWTPVPGATLTADEATEKMCFALDTLNFSFLQVVLIGDGDPPVVEEKVIDVLSTTVADGEICLEFTTIAGARYRVETRSAVDGEWSTVSVSDPAAGDTMKICIPVADTGEGISFFRVIQLASTNPEPPVVEEKEVPVNASTIRDGLLCFTVDAIAGATYRVEGKSEINGPWSEILTSEPAPAPDGPFDVCIDPLTTGALFFRVIQVGTTTEPPTVTEPVAVSGTTIQNGTDFCLSWPTTSGRSYRIESLDTVNGEWTTFRTIVADQTTATECIAMDAETSQFFRIIAVGNSEPTPPSAPREITSVSVSQSENQVCLNWNLNEGTEFEIQQSQDLGQTWSLVEPSSIVDGPTMTTACLSVEGQNLTLFRVFSVSGGTVTDPGNTGSPIEPNTEIGGIGVQVQEEQISITWNALAGASYRIEGLKSVVDEWEVLIDNVDASADEAMTREIPLANDFRFFRVVSN